MEQEKRYTIDIGGGTTLLQIAFLILKLTHVIDWSWWWVLSPIWICVGLWIVLTTIFYFMFVWRQ